MLKGPPPETRRWRPTSRAPVDFFVCKVRWALPKGALGRWPVEPPKIRRFSHGKSPFLIGKPSINGPFSMAMLNNQRVFPKHSHIVFGFFSSGLWETSTCNAPSLGFLMPKTIKVLRLIDVDSFYDWFCQLAVESFNAFARSLMKFHICAVLLCGPPDHGGELLHFLGFIMMVNDWPCSGV